MARNPCRTEKTTTTTYSLVVPTGGSSPTTSTSVVRHAPIGSVGPGLQPPGPDGSDTVHARQDRLQGLLLRAGLAFVFSYASLAMLVDPARFTSYVPSFLPTALAERLLLPAFSAYEALLVVLLVAGRRLFAASLLSAATMAGIIALNPAHFDVLFRNVAIAFSALALAVHAHQCDVHRRQCQAATS